MKELFQELYEDLKGSRTKEGELTIHGFDEDDYEQLYWYIIDQIKPVFKGDFHLWYRKKCHQYGKYRQRYDRNGTVYCPQTSLPISEHSIREQLAVFKYYIYRRATSTIV